MTKGHSTHGEAWSSDRRSRGSTPAGRAYNIKLPLGKGYRASAFCCSQTLTSSIRSTVRLPLGPASEQGPNQALRTGLRTGPHPQHDGQVEVEVLEGQRVHGRHVAAEHRHAACGVFRVQGFRVLVFQGSRVILTTVMRPAGGGRGGGSDLQQRAGAAPSGPTASPLRAPHHPSPPRLPGPPSPHTRPSPRACC